MIDVTASRKCRVPILPTIGLMLIIIIMLVMMMIIEVQARKDAKGYYKILGVSENASQQDIKKAYRKLSLTYHPDKSRNKPKAEQQTLQQQYMKILEAYETLSDEDRRRQYDRGGGFDPFNNQQHYGGGHHNDDGSFHFSFGGGNDHDDPFEGFPQFFKQAFRSQDGGGEHAHRHPFFSFFGDDDDDDDDDSPPFGFHYESSSNTRKSNSAESKRRRTQKTQKKEKEEGGGLFSDLFSVVGDLYNGIVSSLSGGNDEDEEEASYQTVKRIITQINSDGSRTTRVVYEKVPLKKRTVFRF